MRKLMTLFSILSLALAVGSTPAISAEFGIDKSHSNVKFTIKHLVSKVSGSFGDFGGEFTWDEKKPETATGKFFVKTESVNTENKKRDDHLRSPDFFNSSKHPEMTFVVKKVSKAGKDKFKMSGDFTLNGVTKTETFDLEYLGSTEFMGTPKAGFVASTKIKRKDYNMTWNKALDQGGFVLGEDVEITIQIEADGKKKS